MRFDLMRLLDSMTVTNSNTKRDTILTALALVPVIPGGIFMLMRYCSKISVQVNRYYNPARFAQHIYEMYGWGLV